MALMDWFYVYIAVNGFILLSLALYISMLRIKSRTAYGDGGFKPLTKAIRAHSNGTEQVSVFGLLLIALAFSGTASAMMGVLVVVFTVARMAHAYGILFKQFRLKMIGATLTYAMQGLAIAALIFSIVL